MTPHMIFDAVAPLAPEYARPLVDSLRARWERGEHREDHLAIRRAVLDESGRRETSGTETELERWVIAALVNVDGDTNAVFAAAVAERHVRRLAAVVP